MPRAFLYLCAALVAALTSSCVVEANSGPMPPSWPLSYTLVWSEVIPEEDVVVQVTDYSNYFQTKFASVRSSPRGFSAEIGNAAWGIAILLSNLDGSINCTYYKGATVRIPSPAPLMAGNFTYVDDAYVNNERVGHWRWTIEFTPGKPIYKVGLYANRTTGKYVSFRNVGGLGGWFNAPVFNYTAPDDSNFDLPAACQNESTVVVMNLEDGAPPQTHHHTQTFATMAKHAEHVRRHDASRGYTLAMHNFAGRRVEHYKHKLPKPTPAKPENIFRATAEQIAAAPESWDWREFGYVTNVRDQGTCGSCWAFSSAASLEVAYAIAMNTSVYQFSPQMILDCTAQGTKIITAKACYGGWQPTAYDNIINMGIAWESDYPYEGVSGACYANSSKNVHGLTSYLTLSGEDQMLAAIPNGALAVVVEVSTDFFLYQSGILDDPLCGDDLDHGVIVVGYGQNATGTPYWIVKNSFGVAWGEAGYIRIIRGKNMCGIGNNVFQPIMQVAGKQN